MSIVSLRRSLFLLCLSLFILPGSSRGGCGGGNGSPDPTICTSDAQCGSGMACVDNECVVDNSSSDAQAGDTCGGFAGIQCETGLVCDMSDNNFCGADLQGVCVVDEPTACTREYRPVCGCDGVTYGNDCTRRAAYVALDKEGPCEDVEAQEGDVCGGIANIQCAGDLACDFSASQSCGADMAGVCVVEEPTMCTREYAPVCGCDGQTYSNDCTRQASLVALDYVGACNDEVSNDDANDCLCPAVWAPVCDDAGTRYPNSCRAECVGATDTHPCN